MADRMSAKELTQLHTDIEAHPRRHVSQATDRGPMLVVGVEAGE